MVESNCRCCVIVGWEDDWTYHSRGDDFLYGFHGRLVRRCISDCEARLGGEEVGICVGCEGFC